MVFISVSFGSTSWSIIYWQKELKIARNQSKFYPGSPGTIYDQGGGVMVIISHLISCNKTRVNKRVKFVYWPNIIIYMSSINDGLTSCLEVKSALILVFPISLLAGYANSGATPRKKEKWKIDSRIK